MFKSLSGPSKSSGSSAPPPSVIRPGTYNLPRSSGKQSPLPSAESFMAALATGAPSPFPLSSVSGSSISIPPIPRPSSLRISLPLNGSSEKRVLPSWESLMESRRRGLLSPFPASSVFTESPRCKKRRESPQPPSVPGSSSSSSAPPPMSSFLSQFVVSARPFVTAFEMEIKYWIALTNISSSYSFPRRKCQPRVISGFPEINSNFENMPLKTKIPYTPTINYFLSHPNWFIPVYYNNNIGVPITPTVNSLTSLASESSEKCKLLPGRSNINFQEGFVSMDGRLYVKRPGTNGAKDVFVSLSQFRH